MLGLSHCGTHSGEGGGVHQHDELPVEHVQRGVLVGRNVAHVAAVHLHEHAGHRLNQRGGHAPWLRKRGKKPPRTGVNIW